jgi:hypothetical protein
MSEQKEKNPSSDGTAVPEWWKLPFDSTTNFSILGWLLDKFRGRRSEEKTVDMNLED